MKKALCLILALFLIFTCSGCSLNFFSVESLMSPPAQSGKNGEVEEAFKRLMSEKTIQLKTPASGEYQTSFVLFDINSNGVEEAIVFYTDSSIDASVRMAFLECVNETWMISADIKGAGNSVYDVSFSDLDNDGIFEILVGWSLFDNNTTKIVSIYEIMPSDKGVYSLNTLGNEYYNSKFIMDFNGDDKDDIIIVYLDDSREVQHSYFRCFSLSESNELVKYGETRLDRLITGVHSIQFDVVKSDNNSFNRVFIDCLKNDASMFTEVVYFDINNTSLERVFKEPSVTTLRASNIVCSDIDNDGLLEIPAYTTLCGDEKLLTVKKGDVKYTFTMLKWLNTIGDKSEGNINTVYNPLESYLYRITRVNDVTVYYDSLARVLRFCLWDSESELITDELLSIAYRATGDTTEAGGTLLYSSDSGKYYYTITEYGKKFGITDEGVKSSFNIIGGVNPVS